MDTNANLEKKETVNLYKYRYYGPQPCNYKPVACPGEQRDTRGRSNSLPYDSHSSVTACP